MDTTQIEELNRWREAGKEIGRKLGVIAERQRVAKIIKEQAAQSLRDCAILKAGYLSDLGILIAKGETE